ncbi:hypothetical protein ACP70R_010485 [Stipagrostis hirtigluma subsp. patula]
MGCCASAPDDDGGVPATTVTGTHEFTIRRYSQTRGAGAGKSILSQYFTVDGRKWYVRFYPDGYGPAPSLFVAFYVQTLYKPQLRAVRANFTFELLRPDGTVGHARRTDQVVSFDRCCNSWGFRLFIPRAELEAAELGVLHQDSIRVRCTVDVIKKARKKRGDGRNGGAAAVMVPVSDFGENTRRFLTSGRAPFDAKFAVGGRVFEAHGLLVAAQSEWFAAALYGHGKEGTWAEAATPCISVEGTSPEAFEGVLHYIYHDELPEKLMAARGEALMTRELFEAADMFLIERLKKMCANRMCRFINDDTVEGILELAVAHSCEELERACRTHLGRRRAIVLR